MSCRQLGGPCDHTHRGASADDVIKAQDRHLRDAVRAGDTAHEQARSAMRRRWLRPRQAMGWYSGVKEAYAALPDEGDA